MKTTYHGYDVSTREGQLDLYYGGMHDPLESKRSPSGEWGRDPLGNGMVKLVPSGRIVTLEESKKILGY